jgi:hypothetical protein
MQKDYSPPLDSEIKNAVEIFNQHEIETYESCGGGVGHSYPEPTIRFHGGRGEGFKALAVALQNGLQIKDLRRLWQIIDGELIGPTWEITFWRTIDTKKDKHENQSL